MLHKRPRRAGIRRVNACAADVIWPRGDGGGTRRYLAHAICVTSERSGRLDSADNLCAPRGAPVPPLFGRRHPYDHSVRPPTSV